MVTKNKLSYNLSVMVDKIELNKFKNKSNSAGKPYQVMVREIITAFNDDRLKIVPTDGQKESLKKIYQE